MKLQAFNPTAARAARRVLEYNPYHGKDGRFTGKSGAASTSVYSGKPSLGNRKDAIRAEKAYRAQPGTESPLLRQDKRAPIGERQEFHRAAAQAYGGARRLRAAGKRRDAFGAQVAATRYANTARQMGDVARRPEHREQVPQDPKKYTRRGSSGKKPAGDYEGRRQAFVLPHGSPALHQDRGNVAADKVMSAALFTRNALGARQARQDERFVGVDTGLARDYLKDARKWREGKKGASDTASRTAERARARQAAANDNFKAELAARKGRPRRKAAPAPAPDRQPVPQNPSKYTRPTSDGKPGRALSDVMAQRKSEDAIGSRSSSPVNQRERELGRRTKYGQAHTTQSPATARAMSLYWHGNASMAYRDARRARQEGRSGGFAGTRDTADSNARYARFAGSRASQLAKKKRSGR